MDRKIDQNLEKINNNDSSYQVRKSISRLLAVQALYSIDLDDSKKDNWEKAILQILTDYHDEDISANYDSKLLSNIMENTLVNIEFIDHQISNYLTEGWSLIKLEALLRSILRAGVAEICYIDKVPTKVIIDEYTKLTKHFYFESEIGFVNAILDNIGKNLRKISV